jgi:hypothetical protein
MVTLLIHQGLGDHIICNGLVRSLVEKYGSVVLLVKETNFLSVQRMYIDEPRIFCCPVPVDREEEFFEIVCRNNLKIKAGFSDYYNFLEKNQNASDRKFDSFFYRASNVPFENRWDKFFLQRNTEEEDRIFKKLNPDNEPYIFVHEDPLRNLFLNPINKNNYKIIKNDRSEPVFSMLKILENAEELHCMESSLNVLIEHLEKIEDKKLFYYPKVRNYGDHLLAHTKRNWTIVN